MKAPVLTFFNNTVGVGKTSLIYHLAWTFAAMDKRVLVADLDPQARLTAAFLDEECIAAIWENPNPGTTIYQSVKPLTDVKDIARPKTRNVATNIALVPGDVALSGFEEALSEQWSNSMAGSNLYRPMRLLTAFRQVMHMAAHDVGADIILVDTGANLGAINRSVLLASDYVAVVLGADLFSLQGLSNLGPALKRWKKLWQKRLAHWRDSPENSQHPDLHLPAGAVRPIGYLCRQCDLRLDRPIIVLDKWTQRMPNVYREAVLDESPVEGMQQDDDPYCMAIMKHYRSLVPMAQERRKPIFKLTPADGAIGSHASAVADAKKDFRQIAAKIAASMGIEI